jgi:hypothetical protein
MTEDGRKHLDFLQATISRLAGNSFQLKAWSVALGSVAIGLTAKDSHPGLAWLALVPVAAFWLLDAYYLGTERLYREKYSLVVAALRDQSHEATYDMDAGEIVAMQWRSAAKAPSVSLCHGAIALVAVAVTIYGVVFRHAFTTAS